MIHTISTLSTISMAFIAILGIAVPAFLFLLFRKKYKADILPFFIGCAVFFLFGLLIESIFKIAILSSSLGAKIKLNLWLYGIVFGLIAGAFEETGRFIAFKTVLKKRLNYNQNALMYGAGHGGFEAFLVLTGSMVSKFTIHVETSPALCLLLLVGRFAAIGLHIALSVLVWHAVKNSKKLWLYPLAIFLHAFQDALSMILNGYGANLGLVLAVGYCISCIKYCNCCNGMEGRRSVSNRR